MPDNTVNGNQLHFRLSILLIVIVPILQQLALLVLLTRNSLQRLHRCELVLSLYCSSFVTKVDYFLLVDEETLFLADYTIRVCLLDLANPLHFPHTLVQNRIFFEELIRGFSSLLLLWLGLCHFEQTHKRVSGFSKRGL